MLLKQCSIFTLLVAELLCHVFVPEVSVLNVWFCMYFIKSMAVGVLSPESLNFPEAFHTMMCFFGRQCLLVCQSV